MTDPRMSRRKARTILALAAALGTYMFWNFLRMPDPGPRWEMWNLAMLLFWILCMMILVVGVVIVEKSWRDRKNDE